MCTTKLGDLQIHQQNKHGKLRFEDCFPDYVPSS